MSIPVRQLGQREVLCRTPTRCKCLMFQWFRGSHPLPSEASLAARGIPRPKTEQGFFMRY